MTNALKKRWWYGGLIVFVAGCCLLYGRTVFHRFTVPKELQGKAGGEALRRELTALTAPDGWFRKQAGLKNLRHAPKIAATFEPVRTALFPDVEFYWVHLTTYHVFRSQALSAPFSDLVVAVDLKNGKVWSFHRGQIDTEILPFVNSLDIALRNEQDVKQFWILYNSLHPFPPSEVRVFQVREDEWAIVPGKPDAMPGLRLKMDAKQRISHIEVDEVG